MVRHPVVTETNRVFQESFNRWRPPRSIGMRLLGECMRKTVLDYRATEEDFEPPDARGMDNMSYGSAYEVWMIERLKNAGLLKFGGILHKDNQVNVRKYHGNGYMDVWAYYEDEDIAVEIKTKGSRDFDRIVREQSPDKQHYYQLMAYMHFLGFTRGWLIYMDREKHFEGRNGEEIPRWEIIEVQYDPELGAKLERRLIKLSKYKDNGKVPKKEPKTPDDPRCRFCTHRKLCWGEPRNDKSPRVSNLSKRIASNSQARRRRAHDTADAAP